MDDCYDGWRRAGGDKEEEVGVEIVTRWINSVLR